MSRLASSKCIITATFLLMLVGCSSKLSNQPLSSPPYTRISPTTFQKNGLTFFASADFPISMTIFGITGSSQGQTLFLSAGSRIYRSDDFGDLWSQVGDDLRDNLPLGSITYDPFLASV